MKKDIHPTTKEINFKCACGATFVAESTLDKDYDTEICSNCHPFYTGKQKLVDSSGRVEKFMKKREQAQKAAESNVKKINKEDAEKVAEETAESKEEEKKPKKKK